MDAARPERLEDVFGDEGVVDAAVLVLLQRRDATMTDESHFFSANRNSRLQIEQKPFFVENRNRRWQI